MCLYMYIYIYVSVISKKKVLVLKDLKLDILRLYTLKQSNLCQLNLFILQVF